MAGAASGDTVYHLHEFADLDGWADEDHAEALAVFRNSCTAMDDPDWSMMCAIAGDQDDARAFFESFFRPVRIDDGRPALFTGYFEPELDGSLTRTGRFQYPLYAMPAEARRGTWLTRREIETTQVLEGRGLEIAWVDDPVERFFLQIQGSGRIRLQNGEIVRVGYAGSNGHEYRSVGQELVRRGIFSRHQVSAHVIRNWVRRTPEQGRELLYHNPSYVFFRRIDDLPGQSGPIGAMSLPITPMRSLAVDPGYVPLGAPVWIEKAGKRPLHRLMVAQDTGSAIKGAQRADIFFGPGAEAGRRAGRIKDGGRLMVLMPIRRAYALLPDGGAS